MTNFCTKNEQFLLPVRLVTGSSYRWSFIWIFASRLPKFYGKTQVTFIFYSVLVRYVHEMPNTPAKLLRFHVWPLFRHFFALKLIDCAIFRLVFSLVAIDRQGSLASTAILPHTTQLA